MFTKTNTTESVNKVLKDILISKKLSSNWLFIIKKIIYYSSINISKNINCGTKLNKKTIEKIDETYNLKFLYNYSDWYIKKYLEFYEKSDLNLDDYEFTPIDTNIWCLRNTKKEKTYNLSENNNNYFCSCF